MSYTIVVLVKQVPDLNAARIDRTTGDLQLSGQMAISSYDDYAIEAALQLKEAHGGEVVAVTAGPPGAKDALTRALAMGADRALLLGVDDLDNMSSTALSRLLATSVEPLSPDVVLTGQMSDDFGTGEVGPQVAEFLGIPQVSSATSIEAVGPDFTILRDTEDGKQKVSVQTPVLIMAMTGLNEPRYPSLKGIMAAKKKPLEIIESIEAPEGSSGWSAPYGQERTSGGTIVQDVPAAEAASQLVAWLREKKLA